MKTYDIAVVGAGPAGVMACIRAAQLTKNVILIERNDSIGKKILITGKGRCNVTNIAGLDEFIKKFGKRGEFLRTAFGSFFNKELMDFFSSKGLELKIERQGRVFPNTDSALSVISVLNKYLSESNLEILYKRRVIDIRKEGDLFILEVEEGESIRAKKVILATGGASYRATGSSGDGYRIAEKLGHTIIPLKPALVPLKTIEEWAKGLQGLTLKNVRLTYVYAKKKIITEIGEMLFTHFGVSGPLVLDYSGEVINLLDENSDMRLLIDLKPGLDIEQLEERLLREIREQGTKNMKNMLKNLLPNRMIDVFTDLLKLDPDKKTNQITHKERRSIIELLKALPLTIIGALPIEEAMVTCGGVSKKDINPRTMESKVIPGMYLAGEVIDASSIFSGGYNLQQAFSTGYLAGECAASDEL